MNLVAIAATRLLNVLAPSSVKEKINRHGRTKVMSLAAELGNHATALHRHATSIHEYGRHREELVNGAAYLMAQTTYIRQSVTHSSMQQSGLSGLLLSITAEVKNELWRQIVTMRLRAQRLRTEARQRHDWQTFRTVRDMLTLLQLMQRQADQLMHRLN